MDRRILVLRHAKSSWDDPGLADHDRPLNDRGLAALPKLARALTDHGEAVDVVLCSSAARTVATLEGVRGALRDDVEVVVDEDLYGASAGTWLDRCRTREDRVAGVLLVGHNPGLEELVERLSGTGAPAAMDQLATKFPTGALASCSYRGPWAQLGPGACHLDALLTPKQLG